MKEHIWREAQTQLFLHARDVILDFSLWTRADRAQWRQRILRDAHAWRPGSPTYSPTQTPAVHVRLYFLDCPLPICRERLLLRNERALHARAALLQTPMGTATGTAALLAKHPDALNFVIAPETFDAWCSILEPPTSEEEPTVLSCELDATTAPATTATSQAAEQPLPLQPP